MIRPLISLCLSEDFLFKKGREMKSNTYADPVNAIAADKQRDSKYSDENIKPSKQALEKSDLPFNTKYYVKIFSISFYKTIQKVGIALIIIGAAAWAATILLGSLENRRY